MMRNAKKWWSIACWCGSNEKDSILSSHIHYTMQRVASKWWNGVDGVTIKACMCMCLRDGDVKFS